MQRFHPHDEPWGAFVDVKVNAVEVLKRQLRRAKPGTVFVSSACDGWQPIEAEWRLTRRCCELFLERGFQVHVLTKSALMLRDLDVFTGHSASIGIGASDYPTAWFGLHPIKMTLSEPFPRWRVLILAQLHAGTTSTKSVVSVITSLGLYEKQKRRLPVGVHG